MVISVGYILYILITILSVWLARHVAGLRGCRGVVSPDGRNVVRRSGSRQEKIDQICVMTLFILLVGASALRIYTGNDYQTYISHFHDIYRGNYVVTERGFNLVVTAVYGFFQKECYLVIFALFAFLTVGVFLKALYDQSVDFPTSFFLFMMLGTYFQTYNTVRYYFALAIVLYSMRYVLKKQYIRFLIMILIASLFHKTALIVIPLYLLAAVRWKWQHLLIAGILAVSGLFFQEQYMALFIKLYPSYVNEEEYLASGGFSIINVFRCAAVLLFSLYALKGDREWYADREMRFYFQLNLGALALYLCFSFVPFLSRIGYYLNISHLFFLPVLLRTVPEKGPLKMGGKMRNISKKKICRYLVLSAGVIYFLMFLYKSTAVNVRILPYHSWLWTDIAE
ncbi:MAG: EpsG family protein [Lachnospiraceae bacterium]|nr:EpsG family protein [Lachnospiraceae bacterium]